VGAELGLVRLEEEGERLLVACPRSFEELALIGHRFGCQRAISPACRLETTLRQSDGPSRGSSSTTAPTSPARSVERSIRSTSTWAARAAASCSTGRPRRQMPTCLEGQVRAGRGLDDLSAN